MAFKKKTWLGRIAEYPNRRRLTKEDGSSELVTVSREEGQISQEGDAFSPDNFNDLEKRISDGFDDVNQSVETKVRCVFVNTTVSFSSDYGLASIAKTAYSIGDNYRLASIMPYYSFDTAVYNISYLFRESDKAIIVKCPELKGKSLAISFLLTFRKEA